MNFTCTVASEKTEVVFIPRIEDIPQKAGHILYVFDEISATLVPSLSDHSIVLGCGERYKHLESIEKILAKAVELHLGRDAEFIAVGGGVICDMTAFAASVYMRGVNVTLIPTTLLSMVDASLGGKTGVDFLSYKNLVGAFHPAKRVIISVEFLKTLDKREFLNGLAEVIKHGMLTRGELFAHLQSSKKEILARKPDFLEDIVYRSLLVKRDFIEEDPFERSGIRAMLNLGHTFGHALESITGFSGISHGEAVAWGIVRALTAGVLKGVTEPGYAEEATTLLRDYGFPIDKVVEDKEAFLAALRLDKKNRNKVITFVLQKTLSETFLSALDEETILKSLP